MIALALLLRPVELKIYIIRMHDLHTFICNPMTPVYETMEHDNVETLKIMLIKNEIPKYLAINTQFRSSG